MQQPDSSRRGWRDRQKNSILVELTVCQKNITNALNSVVIILKNKVQFVTFPISILLYGRVAELFERSSYFGNLIGNHIRHIWHRSYARISYDSRKISKRRFL